MTAGERIRGQLLRRTPTTLLLAGGAFLAAGRMLRWLAVHLTVAGVLALALLTWWAADRIGWPWLALATGCLCIGLGAVMELQPHWWRRLATAAASRRRLSWYRKRWEPAMVGAGLTLADDLPQLVRHRFGGQPWERDLDVLTVRTLPGQVLEDWRHVAPRLAAAWGRSRVRVHPVHRGTAPAVLELFCSSRPLPPTRSGGQVRTATLQEIDAALGGPVPDVQAPPTLSTPVEEPVDGPVNPWGSTQVVPPAPPDSPRGAFPRQPRADRP